MNASPQGNGLAWKQETYAMQTNIAYAEDKWVVRTCSVTRIGESAGFKIGIIALRVPHPQRLADSSQQICLPTVGIVKYMAVDVMLLTLKSPMMEIGQLRTYLGK